MSELGYLRSQSPRPSLVRMDSSQSVSSIHSSHTFGSQRTLRPVQQEWSRSPSPAPSAATVLSDVWVPPDIGLRLQSPSLPPRMERFTILEAQAVPEEPERLSRLQRVCAKAIPVSSALLVIGFVAGIIYALVAKLKKD